MSHMIATCPDLEFPVVVTPVTLPNPQNYTPCVVTGQGDQVAMLNLLRTAHLNVVAEMNKGIADLFSDYFRAYTNSSYAVTYTTLSVQLPPRYQIPARKTPYGHLNFLASPVEGLYFDPDDIVDS
jgi:hypothetical protein